MSQININCKQNDRREWCKDKRIKKSLWGLGARVCRIVEGGTCEFQDPYPQSDPPHDCVEAHHFAHGMDHHEKAKEELDMLKVVEDVLKEKMKYVDKVDLAFVDVLTRLQNLCPQHCSQRDQHGFRYSWDHWCPICKEIETALYTLRRNRNETQV